MAEAAAIPVIDISAEGADQKQIANSLVDAAAEYGFVYIKSTGLDLRIEQVQNAFEVSRKLFDSPLDEKARCKIQKNNQGWAGMHTETLDPKTQRVGDFKEGFNFGTFKNGKATQPIPSSIEPHQAELAAFREACHNLCRKLLHLFGIGLEVACPRSSPAPIPTLPLPPSSDPLTHHSVNRSTRPISSLGRTRPPSPPARSSGSCTTRRRARHLMCALATCARARIRTTAP